MSAVATVVDADDDEEARRILDDIDDPAGTFYRFGLANSMLNRKRLPKE